MKVLVTGAEGMLGNHVVRNLISLGHQVIGMVEPGQKLNFIQETAAEIRRGDVRNLNDLLAVADGCDAIIHCAASIRTWPSRNNTVNEINYLGTKNIVSVCIKLNIKRLVHVGTANSFGFGDPENPGTEQSPYKAGRYGFDYMDSKKEAQEFVLDAVRNNGLQAVIVNPTFMFGAYDTMPNAGKMILAIANGKVPGHTRGGKNFVNATDCAVAVCNALTMGKIGECYILGGENLSYKEAFKRISKVVKTDVPNRKVPGVFVVLFGVFCEFISLFSRKEPIVSIKASRVSLDYHYYSSMKAISALLLPQTPMENGIQAYLNWKQQNQQR